MIRAGVLGVWLAMAALIFGARAVGALVPSMQ